MNPPEIKAGQRYRFPSDKVKQWDGSAVVAEVKAVDGDFVYLRDTKKLEGYVITVSYFLENYEPVPEPKTRSLTTDDIMKMLAVNPVLWRRLMLSATIFGDWELVTSTQFYAVAQYSHNPFAPNAKIVGPEIEVVE